ncbi:MAG TPA: hypothetical protein VK638_08750, partial [Edaphobacter sp.]|nr:hypothetical protein [Edaphobacter sp.]
MKSASVFTGLHQSEWTKSRLFGHVDVSVRGRCDRVNASAFISRLWRHFRLRQTAHNAAEPGQGILNANAKQVSSSAVYNGVSDLSQRRRISPSCSERAFPRVFSVNPTHRSFRNKLDSDGLCHDVAFVPQDVHVVTTGIDKPHPLCVHVGRAVAIVPFVVRHRP